MTIRIADVTMLKVERTPIVTSDLEVFDHHVLSQRGQETARRTVTESTMPQTELFDPGEVHFLLADA